MGSFRVKGLDQIQKNLQKLEKSAKELENNKELSFDTIFNENFMKQNTNFNNISELITAGGFTVNSQQDFEAIPEDKFDIHIQATTKFASWQEMLGKATEQHIFKKLGF